MNNKQWFKKIFVILVTILTFGIVSPSYAFDHTFGENKTTKRDLQEEHGESTETGNILSIADLPFPTFEVPEISERDYFFAQMIQQAEEQSFLKFGPKIKPVIEEEFRNLILPKMEVAIVETMALLPEVSFDYVQITEMPSGGNSEMIFNVVDKRSNKDVIRFHVRKDHPPQQGYWFNFHYHTHIDQYQTHHDLGSIYWDTNTPPSWLH